ncbi:hypothetical protein EDB84DRAFT_1582072 [Lactarius hengduanensis]|nr:hypothetical protein EDB84DRAFT_1582072 [Lactarius hengduanensis]
MTGAISNGVLQRPSYPYTAAPHCGKRAHEGTWPPPLPFPLGRAIRKGGTRPPAPPSPFAWKGARGRRLRFPWPRRPIRVEWGRAKAKTRGKGTLKGTRLLGPSLPRSRGKGAREACHPLAPSPFARRPQPFPLGCTAPYAWEVGMRSATPGATLPPLARKGVARGYAAQHLPSPLAAPPGTREKGAREGIRAEGGARGHAAPFAREGAHEGKPSPPPYVSRSGGRRGSRRARVHRARTAIFARHSTT